MNGDRLVEDRMNGGHKVRGTRNDLAGRSAEDAIARWYETIGASVQDRRWRSEAGEIDLIVRDGPQLVFVEVKKSRSHAVALARLSDRQMQRIYRAGACYLADKGTDMDTDIRFDVALVDSTGAIEILQNAFPMY